MKAYTITVNGVSYDVTVDEKGNVGSASAPAATPAAKPAAPIPAAAPVQKASAQGNISVTAPMPGKVLAVKVNVGDSVQSGAPVLVLEAMKMENTIQADRDGEVAEIKVNKGDSVLEGTDLIILK